MYSHHEISRCEYILAGRLYTVMDRVVPQQMQQPACELGTALPILAQSRSRDPVINAGAHYEAAHVTLELGPCHLSFRLQDQLKQIDTSADSLIITKHVLLESIPMFNWRGCFLTED